MVPGGKTTQQVDAREVGDESGPWPGRHLVGRPGLHHRAPLENHQCVCQSNGLEGVVRDEQSGASERRELPGQLTSHLCPDRDVERRERLVQQQQPRLGGQRPEECDALRLPAGQRARQRSRLVR